MIHIHDLNYLSEVGVGLNLAFGMFSGMRENLFNIFDKQTNREWLKIKAILSEVGNGSLDISRKLNEVSDKYNKYGELITNHMAAFAIGCIPVFFYILVRSALNPDKLLNDSKVYVCLFFATGPFVLCTFLHIASTVVAFWKFKKIFDRYKVYVDVSVEMKSSIVPTTPTE